MYRGWLSEAILNDKNREKITSASAFITHTCGIMITSETKYLQGASNVSLFLNKVYSSTTKIC